MAEPTINPTYPITPAKSAIKKKKQPQQSGQRKPAQQKKDEQEKPKGIIDTFA